MSNTKWTIMRLLQTGNSPVAGGLRPFAGTVQAYAANFVSNITAADLQLGATESPGAPTFLLSELQTKDVLQT